MSRGELRCRARFAAWCSAGRDPAAPIRVEAEFRFLAARPGCPPARLVAALGTDALPGCDPSSAGRVVELRGLLLGRADLDDELLARVVLWRASELTGAEVAAAANHPAAGLWTCAALGQATAREAATWPTARREEVVAAVRASGPLAFAAVLVADRRPYWDLTQLREPLEELSGDDAAQVFCTLLFEARGLPVDPVGTARAAAAAVS